MANGHAAKRLRQNEEKSERIRVSLSASEWEAVETLVTGASQVHRTDRACRSACLSSLVRLGIACLEYHSGTVQIPEEEAKAIRQRFRLSLKRGMGRVVDRSK